MSENYNIYRAVKTKDQYFNSWEESKVGILTEALKTKIYERYVIKCFVFQRDDFKCRNEECKYLNAPLTLHHIKFQKNNGKDSVKNCITICKTCHNGFHRGKCALTFDEMTYKVNKSEEINWKTVKQKNKSLRKELKYEDHKIIITAALFEALMRFLMINFDEDNEEDD